VGKAVTLHEVAVAVRGNVPNRWVIPFKFYKSRKKYFAKYEIQYFHLCSQIRNSKMDIAASDIDL
jgi:hypothetical protein